MMAPLRVGGRIGPLGTAVLAILVVAGIAFASVDPFTEMFFVSYGIPGAVLAYRRPRNPVGWILILIGYGFIWTTAPTNIDMDAARAGTLPLRDAVLLWLVGFAGQLAFSGFIALTILFPAGTLPGAHLGKVARAVLVLAVGTVLIAMFGPVVSFNPGDSAQSVQVPNPFALLPDLPIWALVPTADANTFMVIGLLAVSILTMLVRFRRSDGTLRLQLRWLVAALVAVLVGIFMGLTSSILLGEDIGGMAWIPVIIAYPMVPLAIMLAVLRYRLYEIDRIISRTIGWAVVSGLLAVTFAAVVVALQGLLSGVIQGSTLAVAASTLVAFALFQPLRRSVQAAVDRRFDRARYDAERIASAFAGHVRSEVDLPRLRLELVRTSDECVRPVTAGVWLRGGLDR